ncbi:MAG: amidophosphoribosyltransferase [Ignavibacteriales bacterium]|nr:amidophosphoribosyltransferase [Ignavibacteriales bacterium]
MTNYQSPITADELHHNCGIAAVQLKHSVKSSSKTLSYIYRLLLNQQNRGQLSTGFTIYNSEKQQLLDTYKDIGSVDEVFQSRNKEFVKDLYERFVGTKGIGHVRYSTSGSEEKNLAQPFERMHGNKWKWFTFCWNGNLANYRELKEQLLDEHEYHLIRNNDTEIIMHFLALELRERNITNLPTVFSNIAKRFDGCFNVAFLNAHGEMIIARDPLGMRPVVYGENDEVFLVASESNALVNCGVTKYKHLPPGHLIYVNANGEHQIIPFAESKKKAHCFFEWVYFANASSVINEKSVYVTRANLGKELAKREWIHKDKTGKLRDDVIVVPVPDTAKASADAMAYELKIPSTEGLLRNRFVGRTFIEGSIREERIRNKYTALPEVLKNKIVLLVDDSVVRGATTKQLVKYLKTEGGAKEVHVRVAAPPLRGPCFYGIAMPTVNELLVPQYEGKPTDGEISEEVLKRITQDLGADSLVYQTIDGLVRSIGFPEKDLCLACINGKYPTESGKELFDEAWEEFRSSELIFSEKKS